MSVEWVEIGPCRLALGDCREVLATLPDGRVDAVVADLPYGVVNRESNGLRNLDKTTADDVTFDLQWAVDQSARLATGSVYLWCGTEQVSDLRAGFVAAGMTTRLCIWHKSNPSPMNGERLWLSGLECCVFARHAKAYFARHCKTPLWHGPVEPDQKHPTQKPVWLMDELVDASVPDGGAVLDFCMGSGSTGVSSVGLGRRFIGIERDPGHFATACKRIRRAVADQRSLLPLEVA